jgi:hypothetical protein
MAREKVYNCGIASGPHGAISGPLYFASLLEQLTVATYDIAEIPLGITSKNHYRFIN